MNYKHAFSALIMIALIAVLLMTRSNKQPNVIRLGDCESQRVYVYLCGLTHDFNDAKEKQHRSLLEKLGKKLNICFVALKPQHRCAQYHNMLCWPHESEVQVLNTYREMRECLGNVHAQGYVGFSNGGFFLNRLVQVVKVGSPVISVGSAGHLDQDPYDNTLYLLAGRHDAIYQSHIVPFYEQLVGSRIVTYFMPYDGGHELEIHSLEAVIRRIDALGDAPSGV